jgi:hypothetical protein
MLGGAQKIILLIFVILLIVIFGIVLWTFVQGDIESWPPTTQTCPDYWIETSSGECSNILHTGTGPKCDSYTSSDPCANYSWSMDGISGCNTPWDGINYGYGKYTPCETGYNPSKL